MPLLTSPIDGSPMQQIKRFGIEIDVCPTSGGVWLDKGELEKIMALIRQAAEEESGTFSARREPPREAYPPQGYSRKPDRYRDDDDRYYDKKRYKKKGALSQVMEIFDF